MVEYLNLVTNPAGRTTSGTVVVVSNYSGTESPDPDLTLTGTDLVAPAPAGWSAHNGVVYYSAANDAVALRVGNTSTAAYAKFDPPPGVAGHVYTTVTQVHSSVPEFTARAYMAYGLSGAEYGAGVYGEGAYGGSGGDIVSITPPSTEVRNGRGTVRSTLATDNSALVGLYVANADQYADETFYFKTAVVENQYTGPYFDGNTQDAPRALYRWSGTPDASTSVADTLPPAKECGLYFGTEERMQWVTAPNIEVGLGTQGWYASGTYLNGGAYARRSAARHQTYSMSWTLKTREELQAIKDYDLGMYGQGPLYFLLPGTYDNVLPPMWSIPRLAAEDGLSLISDQKPRLVPNANGMNNYPAASAHYILREDPTEDTVWRTVTVPVPEDFVLHVGVHGQFSGTAAMSYSVDGGAFAPINPLSMNTEQLTNTSIRGPGLVTFRLTGVGTVTLNSMVAAVHNSFIGPWGTFKAGQGHSGAQWGESGFELTMYSAVKNLYHGAAEFVEVAAWQ